MKISLFALLLLTCLHTFAQETRTLKLKNQVAEYEPRNFYVASVVDDRTDTTLIGTMHVGLANKKVKVNLQGGAAASIGTFIEKDVVQNKAGTPINMHIKQLQVSEKRNGGTGQAVVEISVGYYLKDQLLIEYTGSANQQAMLDATSYIEGLIRKNINETLTRFDDWWGKNKTQYNATGKMVATSIKVSVEEGGTNGDASLIVYNPKRLLTLDDFKGEPEDLNSGAAATYSGIQVSYNIQIQDGKGYVKATVTPTFSTSKSWCRAGSRNPRILNHEQKHFDITALKACELMTAIKNYTFTPEHYEKELEDLRQKAVKEMEDEQRNYDKQTNHGLIAEWQVAWNKDINKQLLQQLCY